MEPVDVLRRVEPLDRGRFVEMVRQRGLDEDPVDVVVRAQILDEALELLLRRLGGETVVDRANAGFLRRLCFRRM